VSHYIRLVPLQYGSAPEVWKIENGTAFRISISNPTIFKADVGGTIWDTLKRLTPWFEPDRKSPFHQTVLQPGEFYPRMARPNDQHPDESPGANPGIQANRDFIAVAGGQLTVLTRQLDRILVFLKLCCCELAGEGASWHAAGPLRLGRTSLASRF
jgi:hypothetical protein